MSISVTHKLNYNLNQQFPHPTEDANDDDPERDEFYTLKNGSPEERGEAIRSKLLDLHASITEVIEDHLTPEMFLKTYEHTKQDIEKVQENFNDIKGRIGTEERMEIEELLTDFSRQAELRLSPLVPPPPAEGVLVLRV